MCAHIDTVTSAWGDGDLLDVRAEMTSLSMAIAVETMFSSLPAPALRQVGADLQTFVKGIHRAMVLPPALIRPLLPANRRYSQDVARLRRTASDIVAERRARGGDYDNLLSTLLSARDTEDGSDQGLTDPEVMDEVLTFFAAGFETIADTLAWTPYLLSQNPEVYSQQLTELEGVLSDDAATYEDIPKLELGTRIITEALRLYPPAWIVTRSVTANIPLGAHLILAGTVVAWSPYLLHRRVDLYDNTGRFIPDRWDSTRYPQPPCTVWVTFGGGALKCIGDHFSYAEATLALATMTKRWNFEIAPGAPVKPAASTTLYPKNLRMRVTRSEL